MNHPENLLYSSTHEWVRAEGARATLGITDYAQEELGDIVFLELPEVGTTLQRDEVFGTVESVKAASDLISPVSGRVVEVHADLPETPEVINEAPYDRGWMIVLEMANPRELDDLMAAAGYGEFITQS